MLIHALIVSHLSRSEFILNDLNQCPCKSVIRSCVKPPEWSKSIRTEETINKVKASIQHDPGVSTGKQSAELSV